MDVLLRPWSVGKELPSVDGMNPLGVEIINSEGMVVATTNIYPHHYHAQKIIDVVNREHILEILKS